MDIDITPNAKTGSFTEEGRQNVLAFSDTLKRIHMRLKAEGYEIRDGKINPPVKSAHSKRPI